MSSKKMKIKIKAEDIKGRDGHTPHRSGTGAHKDKRKRRLNTRSSQLKKAIKDQE